MKTINIIGDIAGRYDEFLELVAKMPAADLIVAVGDLVDRGPKSREVIQWFMDNKDKAIALYGNHEDLMVDGYENGQYGNWFRNGGGWTVKSYAPELPNEQLKVDLIYKEHIEFLKTLPMYYETDDLILSHAPITSLKQVPADPYSRNYYFIWNRNEPHKPLGKFSIHGHNGKYREHKFGDGSVIGICIDDSHHYNLSGIHWPSREIFTVTEPRLPEPEDD
jgi:serine/threonine protein phosphatase 1